MFFVGGGGVPLRCKLLYPTIELHIRCVRWILGADYLMESVQIG